MKKKNLEKIEEMAGDYLQYRYSIYLRTKDVRENEALGVSPDYTFYTGACTFIEAFGGTWWRHFKGDSNKEEDINNPDLYSHTVMFPSDDTIERLDIDAWK